MKSSKFYSLKEKNSFAVNAICPQIFFPSSVEELRTLPELAGQAFYILGEGSNTLFTEEKAPIIIKPDFTGISVNECDEAFKITVGASVSWHQLVCFCIENKMFGLENLALIPGSVGAAPVQNIGAYGVEFSDYCTGICWFDFTTKQMSSLKAADCHFAYRDSIFKQALFNKGIITEITLTLPKQWNANLTYQGLDDLPKDIDAKSLMDKVIELRQKKLPDPKVLPNAGSFFKNPIVTQKTLSTLQLKYPNIPFFQQSDGSVKLAAGWLIEKAGLKGYRHKDVGVHRNQALVLVNYCSEQGREIVGLAKYVQRQIDQQFNINLQPEVRMVTAQGVVLFEQLDY